MNRKVANILKSKIEDLGFVDRLAGLVQPVRVDVKSGDGRSEKVFPISCDLTHSECIKGNYEDLAPNSKHKSVIYFEDNGVRYVRTERNNIYYESSLRLVGWLNLARLYELDCKYDKCDITACVITNIIQAFHGTPYHDSPFLNIYSVIASQEIRDANIFGRYTYNEKVTQYLMAPYDFFALNIQTAFAVPVGCIDDCFVLPNVE